MPQQDRDWYREHYKVSKVPTSNFSPKPKKEIPKHKFRSRLSDLFICTECGNIKEHEAHNGDF